MLPSIDIKVAIYSVPPYVFCDSLRCSGPLSPYLNRKLQLASQFNYTIVGIKKNDNGFCENGGCTGLIGAIQRGDADLALHSYPLEMIPFDLSGVTIGPSLQELPCHIISLLPEPQITRLDVLKSLDVFVSIPNILSFVLIFASLSILPLILHKFRTRSRSSPSPGILFWPLIFSLFGGGESSFYSRFRLRPIFLIISLTSLMLSAVYSGTFTTDLTSKIHHKTIDTISDVVETVHGGDYFATGHTGSKCFIYLEHGESSAFQELRRIGMFGSMVSVLRSISDNPDHYIGFVTPEESDTLRINLCSRLNPNFERWYYSRPFATSLNVGIMNSNLTKPTLKRLSTFIYDLFESHLISIVEGFLKRSTNRLLNPIDADGCLYKATIHQKSRQTYGYKSLIVANYRQSFTFYGCGLLIAVTILLFESLSNL